MDMNTEEMVGILQRLEARLTLAMTPEQHKALLDRDGDSAEELLATITAEVLQMIDVHGRGSEAVSRMAFVLAYSHRKLVELHELEDRVNVLELALATARPHDPAELQPIPHVEPEAKDN